MDLGEFAYASENFELYYLADDKEQVHDLSSKCPEIVDKMKKKMIELKKEMIDEGGDWYDQ